MKAIGYEAAGPIDSSDSLIEKDIPRPELKPNDLLVHVQAVSMNPVDTKVRANPGFGPEENGFKVIGYDAAGVVVEVGERVKSFKKGEEVFYAGDISRPGTNSEFHVVDERIVGKKPKSLNFSESAAIPLTAITAWEILFDSFKLNEGEGENESILIVGAAGGVGSILIQLVKKLTKLKVIATASRQETEDWVKKMGADHVVNHREDIKEQIKKLDLQPKYVASLTASDKHFDAILEVIKPRGHVAFIDDPQSLDILPGKVKALSFSWEFMFARPMFQTEDMAEQQAILNRVSELLDKKEIVSTMQKEFQPIDVENLRKAHELQESGKAIGKIVLTGF